MANHFLPIAAQSFANEEFAFAGSSPATFYVNLVIGSPTIPFSYGWNVYDNILTTTGLSEYAGTNYVPDKPLFALAVDSSGTLVPASVPGQVLYSALGPNTARGGANIRAMVIVRQAGAMPDPVDDQVVMWIEDGVAFDATTGAYLAENGTGADKGWNFTELMPFANTFDYFYPLAVKDLLEGVWGFTSASAAGDLYMNMIVGHHSIAQDVNDASVKNVIDTLGLAMYNGLNYTPDVEIPPLVVARDGLDIQISPVTKPWTHQYSSLWPSTAETNANVWAMLIARKDVSGVVNYVDDRAVKIIRCNISEDPDDGTVYRLNGTRIAMRWQWPRTFARIDAS